MKSSIKKPGKMISIEGLDGAGKSTAISGLMKALPSTAKLYREPGGTLISEVIRSILKGQPYPDNNLNNLIVSEQGIILLEELARNTRTPGLKEFVVAVLTGDGELPSVSTKLTASDELWLFNIARAQLIEDIILPQLNSGRIIVLDRFIDSTIAYQGYGRGLDPSKVSEQCLRACLGIEPDITFYLRIKPETRHARMSSRGQQDRIEKSGNEFFNRVSTGFDQLAATNDRIITIDAERTKIQVQYQMLEQLERL